MLYVHSYKTLENEHTHPQWQKADQWLLPRGVNSEGWTTTGTGKLLQRSSVSCLENPRDGEAWWAAAHGVAQSRTWLKRPSSSSSVSRSVCVGLCVTPRTVAHQAPLSVGFSTQQYWSGLPFPSPEDLPNPGIEPGSPALQADSLVSEPQGRSLGSFWGDGNVWYLDSDDGVTDTYFCQNSSWTLFNGYS